jgi:hypothetical protein
LISRNKAHSNLSPPQHQEELGFLSLFFTHLRIYGDTFTPPFL